MNPVVKAMIEAQLIKSIQNKEHQLQASYEYDASSEEGVETGHPNVLSSIVQQMMEEMPQIEITPVDSSESSEDYGYSAENSPLEIEPIVPQRHEIAAPQRGDRKVTQLPEQVSYRRAP